jgi:hypothetical protein
MTMLINQDQAKRLEIGKKIYRLENINNEIGIGEYEIVGKIINVKGIDITYFIQSTDPTCPLRIETTNRCIANQCYPTHREAKLGLIHHFQNIVESLENNIIENEKKIDTILSTINDKPTLRRSSLLYAKRL